MSLPVSQYEALLAQVRGLRRQAQHVQQLAEPLLFGDANFSQERDVISERFNYNMETLLLDRNDTDACYQSVSSHKTDNSEDENACAKSTHHSVSSEPIGQNSKGISTLYHGTWPVERTMWNSEPACLTNKYASPHRQMEVPSVMSFASSSGAPMERMLVTPDRSRRSSQQLEAKVDMVYSLLAMLGGQEHADMGETLLALSTNPESCLAMRESGCIPLLVQLVQSDRDSETRKKASKALHNLVHSQPDEKLKKRETRILKLLETVCAYNEALRNNVEFVCENISADGDRHPVQTIAHLMKLSFDEGHRQAICQLGGIHSIAKLVEAEHSIHGSTIDETHCILMRRYACMALTNLTFGDSGNKTLLCSYKDFIRALVVQLQSPSDELRQVTASVLRNLSWRADSSSKDILKEAGTVKSLMKSAMMDNKENTLKSILSALWNLSAHCTENKSEICAIRGALSFLVEMLLYKSASKSLAIIENAGGILRNISSQIAVRDDYRETLRDHNCLQILLEQLKSPSLTIVSNACGTLWNLSAKNATDQELLWQLGAPSMLRSLNHSKHKMIAMGSSATLKNLLSAKPGQALTPHLDSTALSLDLPALPTLGMRKQKALLKDLDQNLSETFDNIDPPLSEKKVKNRQNKDVSSNLMKSPTPSSASCSFTSLNISEPSTSFGNEKKLRISQCSGPSSLPYMDGDYKAACTSTPIYGVEDCFFDESDRKSAKNKSKSGAPRKSSGDLSLKLRNSKMELEVVTGYTEIGSEQQQDFSLRYVENDDRMDDCENANGLNLQSTEKTSSSNCVYSEVKVTSDDIIDNDMHKIRQRNKEIVANMDEKDHCSTEDVSDSEIQPTETRNNKNNKMEVNAKYDMVNETFNEGNNSVVNSFLSLDGEDKKNSDCSCPNSEIMSSGVQSNSSTGDVAPSPKPRKLATKAPRLIAKQDQDVDLPEFFSDFPTIRKAVLQTQVPNIIKQEESVEDNTLQREESSEKQDVGKEKLNGVDGFVSEQHTRENVLELQNKTDHTLSVSNKSAPLSSRLQLKSITKSSSGIPTSRFSCRSVVPKPENGECAGVEISRHLDNGSDMAQDFLIREMTKPISCDIVSSASPSRDSRSGEGVDYPENSNTRREVKGEAMQAPNEDSGRKCDVLSNTIELGLCFDDRRVTSSSEIEKFAFGKKKPNSAINTSAKLNIYSEELEKQSNSSNSPEECPSSGRCINESSESSTIIPQPIYGRLHDNTSPIAENLSSDMKKSGSSKSLGKILDLSPEYNCLVFTDKNGERLDRSCNETGNVVDTRMLDPDAMIESLDRFTAELVSQASSHLQNKDSMYKSSTTDNTWDEHSSPNEVTFPSISVSAPNVVSFKSENDTSSSNKIDLDVPDGVYQPSNDFSSFNTSTMTDSTLIAMEATKIVAAFKESADMSLSANSLVSLELDLVQPPSHLNSLSNSIIGFDSKPNSPKMTRKKSLPSNIMVRRALNHSFSHTSSAENLENYVDLDSNTSEVSNSKKSFMINGPVSREFPHMSHGIKSTTNLSHCVTSSRMHSVTDIENINPPSIFNEVTDLCNSLADVASSAICSETEVFEDCFTHVADNTFQTENDITEFSDANSITPIQSDVNSSSSENTPKRQRSLSKSLTSKQKRALAKERYKTYTIAAGMVTKESLMNDEEVANEETNSSLDYFKTARDSSLSDEKTYTVDTKENSKLSPKERRLSERSRFQTQVVEVSQLHNILPDNSSQPDRENESDISSTSPQPSPGSSPSRSRISVRKNFLQRRLSNKERFKTQTLADSPSSDLPICDSPPINNDSELHLLVEKEANKVLKSLRDAKTNYDELLDCETLSLVSNEDESEHNSGGSANYRTYHKSWGLKHNLPVIDNLAAADDAACDSPENDSVASDSENEATRVPRKPKIVKPEEKKLQENSTKLEEPKGIRGKRKPLYSKSNLAKVTPKSIKPVRNLTTNLVKNVTSTLKSVTPTKSQISKPNKITTKPPVQTKTSIRPVSVGGSPQKTAPQSNVSYRNSTKYGMSRPLSDSRVSQPRPLERQGTFTKDESPISTPQPQIKSKIPGFASKIPCGGNTKYIASKIPAKQSNIPRSGLFKSASSERNPKTTNSKVYNRSTSADSRESGMSRKIQSSLSSHSLKNEPGKVQQNGAIKKTIQNQRSNSNTSLNGSNNTKKQVASKIASIWKKIEESKKKTPLKNDSKKWIEAQAEAYNEMDSDTVVLRNRNSDDNAPKRISRLGSFIVMDENEDSVNINQIP